MTFLNTIKIVMANFAAVWKLLLYYVICLAVLLTSLCFAAAPVFDVLRDAGIFADMLDMLKGIFGDSSVTASIAVPGNAFANAFDVLGDNMATLAPYIVIVMLMLFVVIPFVLGLAEIAVGETLYGYMSSQTKYSFSRSFISKVGKASLLQLAKLLVLIPINIIVILEVYGVLQLIASDSVGLVFAAFLILLITIVTLAVKEAIFSCWMPAMLVLDIGPFKALKKNMRIVLRKFFRIFSTNFVLILAMFAVNVFFGVFTLGIALVITVPLTTFVFIVSGMVTYFNEQGMKFYVTHGAIYEPKRMEEQDGIVRLKKIV